MFSFLRKAIDAILKFLGFRRKDKAENGDNDVMSSGKALTEEQVRSAATKTFKLLSELIKETDVPKLREEQEAVLVGQLAPLIFAEMTAVEKDLDLISQERADLILSRRALRVNTERLLADDFNTDLENVGAIDPGDIKQMLENGQISKDKADLMLLFIELKGAIDEEALLANALDITVEDLRDANSKVGPAYETAVSGAINDRLITQAQGDLFPSRQGYQTAIRDVVAAGLMSEAQADLAVSSYQYGVFEEAALLEALDINFEKWQMGRRKMRRNYELVLRRVVEAELITEEQGRLLSRRQGSGFNG